MGVYAKETFGQLTPFQRIKLASEQGEDLHPGYSQKVKNGITRSWLKTPFIQGGWSISRPDKLLLNSDGPFLFSGDYNSLKSGWMEGAIASAQNAVLELLKP